MIRIRAVIELVSLVSSFALMFLLITIFSNVLSPNKSILIIISFTPLVIYVFSFKIEKAIQKLHMRMKKPNEREMLESRLLEHKQELLQKLDVVQHEIEIIHSEDAEMARLANKVIKEGGTGFASREDLAKMYYDLDKRIKDIENKKTNQTSTTEENAPKSDKIIF